MLNRKNNYPTLALFFVATLIMAISCSRDLEDLEPVDFPSNGDVFIDGFPAGLNYVAFGKIAAFQVDEDITFEGTASMRFEVPDDGDPAGSFAGGAYITDVPRDLTSFDALTFWARATQPATINEVGFGNDLGEAKFAVSIQNLPVNSNWQKYIIPIPDPSVLTQERGMFIYSETPENGKGYTFWIDELQFEKLGTIARPRPAILETQDQVIIAETGASLPIGGTFTTFNLPAGIDQRVETAPAYFDYESSNTSVAVVNEFGIVSVIDSGEAVITAKLGDIDALGSLTVTSSGAALLPATPAPTPTVSQDSVISLYSNVYDDVTVDTFNPFWEFSTTQNTEVQIGDDDVIKYSMLNFVGILTEAEQIDASEMTHFHIDIWTPDPTALPASFKVLLVDFGADGNFGGDDDSSHELSFTSPTLQTEEWVSLDIPLSSFTGLVRRENIAQLVLSGELPNVFVDNIYFYQGEDTGGGGPDAPEAAAPTPPSRNADDVISLFSEAYNDVPVDTWRTDFSVADFADVEIAGNATKRYTNLDFVGIETVMNQLDITQMTHFHVDVWSPNFSFFGVKVVDFGADGGFDGGDDTEHQVDFAGPVQGEWIGYDIPIADFINLTSQQNIAQYIFVGQPSGASIVYMDNLYFYREGSTGGGDDPTVAAPAPPARNASDVISLFSEAYDDVPVDTWRTDFSVSDFEDVLVAGNPTKKYSNLDFVGIETVMSQLDITQMTHFHVDVWSSDFDFFAVKLVDFGPDGGFDGGDDTEHQVDFAGPTQGQWISYDIPITDFVNLTTRANIAQYIFVGQPSGATTVYMDNLYFYKDGGAPSDEPPVAAPAPTQDAANVISLFSEAYDDVPVDTWRTDFSVSDFEDITIAGNETKKYSNLDFVGIETVMSQIDITQMTHFHIDVWSADHTFFGIKLVDFGPDGGFDGGDDTEHQVDFAGPVQGEWIGYDIPIADFINLTSQQNIAQYILVGQPSGATTIFVDNMFFYKDDDGSTPTEPTIAAPTPTFAAGDVISLFSEAYDDVPVDTWRTEWSVSDFEDVMVAGNATKKYSNLDFVGIETVMSQIDITEMTHFHIDVWSADHTFFAVKLVDFGPDGGFDGGDDTEHQIDYADPAQGQWISYDIPITDFVNLANKENLAQYILVGQPTGSNTIFVDNIYFHR